MRFLIPRLHPVDKFIAWSVLDAGHSLDIITSGDDSYLDEWFNSTDLVTGFHLDSHHASGYDAETYIRWYGEQLDTHIYERGIDCILPSAATDMILSEIGFLNDKHYRLGITEEGAEIFSDKERYMDMLAKAGMDVPKVYEVVAPGQVAHNYDISFPCICKPSRGTGSKGIFVSESPTKHEWFFSPSDRPQDFSERAEKVHDRMADGSLRNYIYHAEGGSYIVQEFVQGTCISLGGVTVDGKLILECMHEVDVTPLPYRSEIGFSFDMNYSEKLQKMAQRVISQLEVALPFPNGAWRADCIWTDDRLVVIDVAPRMCTTATRALAASGSSIAYGDGVINAILGLPTVRCEQKYTVRCRVLDLPKGKVKEIIIPEWNDVDEFEEPSDVIYEPRNDLQSWNRGWVLDTARTLDIANENIDQYLSELRVEME